MRTKWLSAGLLMTAMAACSPAVNGDSNPKPGSEQDLLARRRATAGRLMSLKKASSSLEAPPGSDGASGDDGSGCIPWPPSEPDGGVGYVDAGGSDGTGYDDAGAGDGWGIADAGVSDGSDGSWDAGTGGVYDAGTPSDGVDGWDGWDGWDGTVDGGWSDGSEDGSAIDDAGVVVIEDAGPPQEQDYSCAGDCGGYGGGCYCDTACQQMGDCCADKVELCGDEPPPPEPNYCESDGGASDGSDGSEGSYDAGVPSGDDAGDGASDGDPTSGGDGASGGSCEGQCGGKADGCWCDPACSLFGDCCADKAETCDQGTPALSCEGQCGGHAAGCWCDALCKKLGDCCPDKVEVCGGGKPGKPGKPGKKK